MDPARLDSLERTIARLAQELAEARRALAELRADMPAATVTPPVSAPAPAAAPSTIVPAPTAPPRTAPLKASPAPRAAPPTNDGLEQFVGRYGALVLAVLTIVMGAGALVSWAISHGLLGPWMRVSLGALLAAVLAGTGWWLRNRGSRAFGNSLLALALAVIHVVAWGAGPRLHLVRPFVALNIAAAASFLLAALAVTEGEETLFAVGLGGALIAPFVMATGEPQRLLLAVYGLILLVAAIRTIGVRAWWTAVALAAVGIVVYTVSVVGMKSGTEWIDREFAAAFAGVICVLALLVERKPSRPWLALTAVATMAIAMLRARVAGAASVEALLRTPDIPIAALTGTALFFAVVRNIDDREPSGAWVLSVLMVPPLFLSTALNGLGAVAGPVSGSVVLTWGLAYAIAALLARGIRRGVLLAASAFAGLWAISLVLARSPDALPFALAAFAVLIAFVSKSEAQPVVLLAAGASLLVAFGTAAIHLMEQTGYTTTPFLSIASFGAGSAVAATYLAARFGLPDKGVPFFEEVGRNSAAAGGTSLLAFVWGYLELRRAFSSDASTFLLIAYYAACGVIAIQQGRTRGSGRLRQIGLSLAVVAALYAIVAASDVQQIGLRVGSYLLVGAFLLGVAWWYRGDDARVTKRGTDPAHPVTDR